MEQICKFCEKRDLQRHVPNLSIDLEKAIESGTVTQPIEQSDFNNLDIDIVSNATRLREPFDALEYDVSLRRLSTEFSSGTGNTTVSQSTPPSEGSAD